MGQRRERSNRCWTVAVRRGDGSIDRLGVSVISVRRVPADAWVDGRSASPRAGS